MKSLHPTLASFLVESPISGFKMIHHPYLVDVMFGGSDVEIIRANAMFENKRNFIEQALKEKQFAKAVFLCERPYRLEFFIEYLNGQEAVDPNMYWGLLSEIYVDSEGASKNIDVWMMLLSECHNNDLLMNQDDLGFYRSLNNELTIYRGVESLFSKNQSLSWTLSKETATWFANRFERGGIVISGTVKKKDIFAAFSGRGESEILVDSNLISLRVK